MAFTFLDFVSALILCARPSSRLHNMISAACALLEQVQAIKGQVYLKEKESTSLTARHCQRS